MNEALSYSDELRDYRNRQAQKEIAHRQAEKERLAELERKAAAYDAVLDYRNTEKERNGGWADDELKKMKAFASGWIRASLDRLHAWVDEWVTYADDIDIHFMTNDDEADKECFGKIEAHGYRRTPRPETGDHDCTDEVKLI